MTMLLFSLVFFAACSKQAVTTGTNPQPTVNTNTNPQPSATDNSAPVQQIPASDIGVEHDVNIQNEVGVNLDDVAGDNTTATGSG